MKFSLPRKGSVIAALLVLSCGGATYAQALMQAQPFTSYNGTGAPGAWEPTHNKAGVTMPDAIRDEHAPRKLNNAPNYKTFTVAKKHLSDEAKAANAGYENHPDYGMLYPGAPCSNCYELIGERTEMSKSFVMEGVQDGKKQKMTQTSTQPMHYRDAAGNWVTIKTELAPDANKKGVYSIPNENVPVKINTNAGNNFSSLGKEGDDIKFNRNLELIYVQPDGREVSLGMADYTHHTAGDGGVYVTDAWPGIDIEMNILWGAIETNFHLNHAQPQYAGGKLLIRDRLQFGKGLGFSNNGRETGSGELIISDNTGAARYAIGQAVAYEQNDRKNTTATLNYFIGSDNVLDINLPGTYLNKPAAAYPIIIDPLVSVATSVTVNGSTYLTALTATSGCPYLNAANTPTNCTITDIQYAFQYTAVAPCWTDYGGSFFYKGTCRSPGTLAAGYVWTCNPAGTAPGTCTATGGTAYSIWGTPGATTSGIGPCVPAPQCASYPLNITMYLYSSYLATGPCVSTWIYGSQPLVLTVIGYTVQEVSTTASPATICAGSSTSLTATGTYGVPPYTFTWTPGPVTGSPATVSPTTTTVYTVTITDACGITATGTTTVTVNTEDPINGVLSLCAGNTTTLTDGSTTGAHTWSSSTTTVATITSPGGVVTAVSPGTTTITYTSTGTGCHATAVLTVTPLPTAILGNETLCIGSTTSLSDATSGGVWSSSNTAIATVNSTTGLVSGLAVGTSVITYGSASCYATAIVTVDLLAPITGTTTVCLGSTSLLSDAVSGGTWTSLNTAVATISGGGLVTSVSTGTSVISYVLPSGCNTATVFSVVVDAPITGTAQMCVGMGTTLNDATTGGTWGSSNTSVATVVAATGAVTGVTAGTATITYTSSVGCTTTINVTVNPLPAAISGVLNVCVGLTTVLSDMTPGGAWISSNGTIAGVNTAGVVTGIMAGAVTITYKLPTGCIITAPLVVYPLPAAISGPANVCVGSSITLSDASAGGTWASNAPAIAPIGATTGVVNGVSAGAAVITYVLPTGCQTTTPITVVPLPGAPGTASLQYCQGAPSYSLTATGSDLLWFTSATSNPGTTTAPIPPTGTPGVTTWWVSQTVNGCQGARAPLQVTVYQTPVFEIKPARPTACQNDSISFYSVGPTFTGETYTWVLPSNGVLYPGSSLHSSKITMDYTEPLGNNYIVLTVGDGYAPCNVTDSLPMPVYYNNPVASFYLSPNICVGDSVTIALSYIGPGVTDYSWDFGPATIITESSNHGGPFVLTWPSAGIYTVALTAISNLNCPSVPILDTVDVHALPNASFIFKPKSNNTLCLEDSVLFIANDTAYNDGYLWQPAHGFNNDNKPVIWGKVEETQSDITLTVTTPFGCKSSTTQQLDPGTCCTVMFPNAFTPNGDGHNDVFRPLFNGYHNFHFFRIVNRWGETIFESSNSLPSWDGSFNGVPQDIGTYYYFLQYDCGGNTIEAKGDVTLIR